ncbi:MAG: hypothetical protein U0V04_06390 [Spirosomataceae bacterium]
MDFNKTIDQIISEIEVAADFGLHNDGIWSVRYNPFWGYRRDDNNIFALASSSFILNQIKAHLAEYQRSKVNRISEKIRKVYPKYQNKDGGITYNFYPTKPSKHFANGYLMHRFDHFRLPDDIDDTALIYLTSDYKKHDISELKKRLKNHLTPTPSGEIYDTWFGNNMPHEQDVCALCNLMFLIFSSNIPQETEDINTLNFLADNIQHLLTKPYSIARHYGHPALIVYHYARLMAGFRIEVLEKRKNELIETSKKILLSEKNPFFRKITEISLLKLGENLRNKNFEFDDREDYTFIGAPLAPYSFFGNLAFRKPFLIFYQSKIHQLAINLEHLILSSNIAGK